MQSKLKDVLIRFYKPDMTNYIAENPGEFGEAVKLSLSDEHPYCWRAASLVWDCMTENDERVKPFVKKYLSALKNKKDGHQREILKILCLMDLEDKYEGGLFDLCINVWKDINKNSSVRVTAFKFLIKIAVKYPELRSEIIYLANENYLETLSPGIKNSVGRMIKELK